MATNVFQITPYSSFRFVNEAGITDDRYHTLPFDERPDPLNYFQKIQKTDTNFRVQLLSDFVPTFQIFTCKDIFVKTVDFSTRTVVDATYLLYDAEVDFSDLDEGSYYGKLTYVDELTVLQDIRTSPLYIAEDHPETFLYQSTNTYNDKGVVFVNDDKSLMIFSIRVESSFDEFQPLSDDVGFVDQPYDVEVLNNTPYQNEKLYIYIVPDWMIWKLNLYFTLNKVKVEQTYYARVEGNKFSPTRPDYGTLLPNGLLRPTFWSIDIIPNFNFNLEQINPGDTPTGEIVVIKKVWPLPPFTASFTASFTIAGVFKTFSNLIRVAITNTGLDEFTMKLGTTVGGDEIATLDVKPILTGSYDVGHNFSGVTTVHVTIPSGVNIKALFDYNQYDAPDITPPDAGITGSMPKGATLVYTELVIGDFALDWNVGTGLGQRAWTGWGLCDGQDGRPNRSNKYSRGWDKSQPDQRGQQVGNPGSLLVQSENQVGRHRHLTPNSNDANGFGKPATGDRPQEGPDMFTNYNTDVDPDPMDISPDSLYDVWVIKITD